MYIRLVYNTTESCWNSPPSRLPPAALGLADIPSFGMGNLAVALGYQLFNWALQLSILAACSSPYLVVHCGDSSRGHTSSRRSVSATMSRKWWANISIKDLFVPELYTRLRSTSLDMSANPRGACASASKSKCALVTCIHVRYIRDMIRSRRMMHHQSLLRAFWCLSTCDRWDSGHWVWGSEAYRCAPAILAC